MPEHRASLRPFQERVFDLLMMGENVILQAPTGSGKTRAALYPFLYSLDPYTNYHNRLPLKCIYSVPMRVLAKQFFDKYHQIVKDYKISFGLDKSISTSIQTGEQRDDREFSSNLIFTTIDQTLSSYLIAPYSLPRRKANINAAAVMGSYLVFDEFHLYDPASTLPTTLLMLQRLKGIAPFILMTATFSKDMLEGLGKALGAVVVPSSAEEIQQLQELDSQKKDRFYQVANEPLSAQAVLDNHDRRSLVICNTVDRARYLFEQIRDNQNRPPDVEVFLLHSRFLREDRNQTEDKIRELFAKDNKDGSAIVVATQAIEVGVDITSQVLHTELAPANAILQRAGRCARYKDDKGTVFVYAESFQSNDEKVDLTEEIAPYREQGEQFISTLAYLREHQGQKLDFAAEQDFISAVHGEADAKAISALEGDKYNHRREMHAVMQGDFEGASRLVRNVFQQQVAIHPNPDALRDSPFDVPSFGLHPGTVQKYVNAWLERGIDTDLDWCVKYLVQGEKDKESDEDQTNRTQYDWVEVYTNKTAWGAPLLIINPELATYDPVLGFLADRGGVWDQKRLDLPPIKARSEGQRFTYRLETYEDHIRRVFEAYQEMWGEMAHFATKLETQFRWETGSIQKAVELAVLLHDVGKLNRKWQRWVRDYQAAIEGDYADGEAYAHTELQNDHHRQIEQQMGKRPWHAVEGAVATVPILEAVLGDDHPLTFAVFSAICRHHTPHADSHQRFKLIQDALHHVQRSKEDYFLPLLKQLNLNGLSDIMEVDNKAVVSFIIQPDDNNDYGHHKGGFLAYLLIARVLRLADQQGTEKGSR